MNISLVILTLMLGSAQAKESFVGSDWKIEDYVRTDEGVSAWGDDEIKQVLHKVIQLKKESVILGGKTCKATLRSLPPVAVTKLTLLSDLNLKRKCGTSKPEGDVYSLDLDCKDQVRFTPYLVHLGKDRAIGFGDTIEFCLVRSK